MGGNLWRTTGDIKDQYARMAQIGFSQAGLATYAGPGPLERSRHARSRQRRHDTDEYRTHMSLWAMLAAPLLAGNDLTT